jgi:hypothetical protein
MQTENDPGKRLEEHVKTIEQEAQRGQLTSPRGKEATAEAMDVFRREEDSILEIAQRNCILMPFFAHHFAKAHGDRYAQEAVTLARQYSNEKYWETRSENQSNVHYVSDQPENTPKAKVLRRGIDALFHAGLMRPQLPINGVLDKDYFKAVGSYSLLAVGASMGRSNKNVYQRLGENFEDIADVLNQAGRDIFKDNTY